MRKITPEDIRKVLERHGEALLDLGCSNWLRDMGPWLNINNPYLYDLIKPELRYNDEWEILLYEEVSRELADAVIAEYCNSDPRAAKSILSLLV